MTLSNIYGPNQDEPDFFSNVIEKIESVPNDNRITSGDFNFVFDVQLDKIGKPETHIKARDVVKTWMDETDVIDIWRHQHADEKKYTWHGIRGTPPKHVLSRIDFHLVSFGIVGRVSESCIKPGFRSDHSAPIIKVEFHSNSRGPGYWKMNTSLLRDADYIKSMKKVVQDTVQENPNTDALLLWDTVKCKIRGETIRISSMKKKKRNEELLRLQKLQEMLFTETQQNPYDKAKQEEYLDVGAQIENIIEQKTKGNILRCKIKWYEEGEKCSKYFLNLEKRNFNNKCITKLITSEGKTVTTDPEILKEEQLFYEKLYTSMKPETTGPILEEFLGDELQIPVLTEDEKQEIDGHITEEEMFNCIKTFKNGKSPGLDGIPIEFYKVFWLDIKEYLVNAVNRAYENGELAMSQRQGTITLLPKKDKDCLYLKNWRPISLLNSDYKLIAKCIALRLKKVLEILIHKDQTGFVPNRYIGENINTILGILEYADFEDIPGVLVVIDFEKAFDYLEWPFIFKVLERFNFGDTLTHWVKTLYRNPTSCIHNNGWRSDFFNLSRGVRQGCPLSPYLFILCAEILSVAVRSRDTITGLKIQDQEMKISQYADDTSVFLSADSANLKETVDLFTKFRQISGLKINLDKTEVLRIGSIANTNVTYWPESNLRWTNGPVKILGINVTPNKKELLEVNYHPKHNKLKNLYNLWQQRHLSLKGKITIIKSLGISQLIYLMGNIPSPPVQLCKDVQSTNFKFIWNDKQDRIKRQILCMDYKDGGLRMKDVSCLDKSLKISWIKRLMTQSAGTNWRYLLEVQFNPLKTMGLSFFKCNLSSSDFKSTFKNSLYSTFWFEALSFWCEFNYRDDITEVDEILAQPIWYNSHIKLNKRPIFRKLWYEAGIQTIKDLTNGQNTSILSHQAITRKYGNDKSFLLYHGIISALPAEWKRKLKSNAEFKNDNVYIIDKLLSVTQTSKYIYETLNKSRNVDLNTLVMKWNEELNSDMSSENLLHYLMKIPEATVSYKLQSFQYKLIHRAHTTNIFACHIGKAVTDRCTFCSSQKESLSHLFWECFYSQRFWSDVSNWLHNRSNVDARLNEMVVIFGHENSLISLCTIIGKSIIYACKTKQHLPNIESFIAQMLSIERWERDIAVRKGKLPAHKMKWYIPDTD